jgi:hypothetical protein
MLVCKRCGMKMDVCGYYRRALGEKNYCQISACRDDREECSLWQSYTEIDVESR